MDEMQARQRIRTAYGRLRHSQGMGYGTDPGQDDRSVAYHINAIRNAGGGLWDDGIAGEYIRNLESQFEEEITSDGRMDMEEDDFPRGHHLFDDGEMANQRYDRSM